MSSQKEIINDAYTAAVITAGAVSYASKKFLKTPLGVPETVNEAAKLVGRIPSPKKSLRKRFSLPPFGH